MADWHVRDADKSSVVNLTTGDRLIVTLGEAPSTGYFWDITEIDTSILATPGRIYTTDEPASIGGSGYAQFTFAAISEGATTLKLRQSRAWSGPVRQYFWIEVRVGAAGLADAVFGALQQARMRVLPQHLDWVVTLIGQDRAQVCPSLPRIVRVKSGLLAETR